MLDREEAETFRREMEGFLLSKRTRVEFTLTHWHVVMYTLGSQPIVRCDFHAKSETL